MRLRLLVALAVLSSASVAASASVVSYTSQSSFNAATTGLTSYSFPGSGNEVSKPYTNGPLTFSDSTGTFFDLNDGFYGSGQTYLDDLSPSVEQISLSGATALAFNIGTFNSGETLTFDVGGNAFTFTTPGAKSPIFVGFTSDSPITSLSVSDGTKDEIDILNFQVGSAANVAATPEPSSIALLGTGLLGFAGLVRRRFV